jgi:hypothetical protein
MTTEELEILKAILEEIKQLRQQLKEMEHSIITAMP